MISKVDNPICSRWTCRWTGEKPPSTAADDRVPRDIESTSSWPGGTLPRFGAAPPESSRSQRQSYFSLFLVSSSFYSPTSFIWPSSSPRIHNPITSTYYCFLVLGNLFNPRTGNDLLGNVCFKIIDSVPNSRTRGHVDSIRRPHSSAFWKPAS